MLNEKELKIIQDKLDFNYKFIESSNNRLTQLKYKIALAEKHDNEQSEIDEYREDYEFEYEELEKSKMAYSTIQNLMSDLGYYIDKKGQLVKSDKG